MRPLFPSAAVREQKYALISSLRAQGSPLRSLDADKPGPDSVFLTAEGETQPEPARTLVVSQAGLSLHPDVDADPKSAVSGESCSVRVALGGVRIIAKK